MKLTIVVLVIWLGGCGAKDYASRPPKETPIPVKSEQVDQMPVLTPLEPQAGYLWRGLKWTMLPDDLVGDFMTRLEDSPDSNAYCALGATVLGGAAIGLVIRGTGSWFFGKPVESDANHPFWRRLNATVKTASHGVVRGAAFSGACYLFLTGAQPLPFEGILGSRFRDVSCAMVLGGLSTVAIAPFIHGWANRHWGAPDSWSERIINSHPKVRKAFDHIHSWTNKSDLGMSVRYKVAPRLSIVALGSGIGALIYNWLEDCGSDQSQSQSQGQPSD